MGEENAQRFDYSVIIVTCFVIAPQGTMWNWKRITSKSDNWMTSLLPTTMASYGSAWIRIPKLVNTE